MYPYSYFYPSTNPQLDPNPPTNPPLQPTNPFFTNLAITSSILWPAHALRPYQTQVAHAILASIHKTTPVNQIAVAFARQSGKDELLAQLISLLLWQLHTTETSILVVNPTYRPQGLIARRRLLARLTSPSAQKLFPIPTADHTTISLNRARCTFLTSHSQAQARGETASLLLVANEAQSIPPDRWDAVFDPMTASSNAPQIFSGTVWTSSTLLSRQMAYLSELERKDGHRRVFKIGWEEIADVSYVY